MGVNGQWEIMRGLLRERLEVLSVFFDICEIPVLGFFK
jgi:hypothetical protein